MKVNVSYQQLTKKQLKNYIECLLSLKSDQQIIKRLQEAKDLFENLTQRSLNCIDMPQISNFLKFNIFIEYKLEVLCQILYQNDSNVKTNLFPIPTSSPLHFNQILQLSYGQVDYLHKLSFILS